MSSQIIPDTGLPLGKYVIQVVPVDETSMTKTKRISCPLFSSTTQCKSGDFSVISTIGGPTLEVSIESTLWEVGSSQTFEWEGRNLNGEVVDIYILSLDETSPADEYLILTAGKSSGKIQYIVPSEIKTTYPTKAYVLEARSKGVLSAVSVSFAVVARTTFNVIKPSNTNPHYKGSQYEIEWTSQGVPFDIIVRLYSTGSTIIDSQRVTKSGKACAFPFTYLGVHQTDCVRGGGYGVGFTEWCPTNVIGPNNDPGETEECTPLSLIGQLNPNDGILYTPDTLPASISPYSSAVGRFRWPIAEEDLPGAGHGYYLEITEDPQQSSEQLAGQQQFEGSRSKAFEISCAWYRIEITLSKNSRAPEGANHVVTEIARVTGLQEQNIDVVDIGTLNPIVIVVDLKSSSDNMNLKKCPIAGLSGLLDYKDIDSQIVPSATRIDFSDPDPNGNNTNVTAGEVYTRIADSHWLLIITIAIVVSIAVLIVFITVFKTKRKVKKAKFTYRESQRIRQDWREARTKSQRVYYYNAVTNESSWDPPTNVINVYFDEGSNNKEGEDEQNNDIVKAEKDLPPGWHATIDSETNKIFFYHDDGETTTWDKPEWVPRGWVPHEDQWEEFTADAGDTYYYNSRTGTTTWEPPSAPIDRKGRLAGIINKRISGNGVSEAGGRKEHARTGERNWTDIRKQQQDRRKFEKNEPAVGIELAARELRELSQAQDK
jgi:hypothetical protein